MLLEGLVAGCVMLLGLTLAQLSRILRGQRVILSHLQQLSRHQPPDDGGI